MMAPIEECWSNFIQIEETKLNYYVNIYDDSDIPEEVGNTYDMQDLFSRLSEACERSGFPDVQVEVMAENFGVQLLPVQK